MANNTVVDPQYLEQVMTKALLEDKDFVVTVTRVFERDYFDSSELQSIFSLVKEYFETHKELPSKEIVINSLPDSERSAVRGHFDNVFSMDINIPRHRDWLMEQTDVYLRDKAIKDAIRRSVDIIDESGNTGNIRTLVEEALCRTIDIDLGLNYFGDLGPRLQRMFTDDIHRLPTYFPAFDEYINGGFPPKTLSVFVAKIHGFKCLSYNSYIHIQENEVIKKIKIGEFYEKYINTYDDEYYRQKGDSMKQKGTKKIDLFINKYGEEEGSKRYNQWLENNRNAQRKKKGINTLEWCIEKYGEEEGTRRYNESTERRRSGAENINTLEYYIEKYGQDEGTKKYREKNRSISDKGRGTLEYFTEKYGEVDGARKHTQYINRQKYSHSKEGYIERYGEVEGKLLWEERMEHLKHTTSLEGFIKRHGEKEGLIKWKERQEKWMKSYKKSNFSKISQEVFWVLSENIDDLSNIYFAELDENKNKDDSGRNHEYNLDLGDSFIKPDFIKDNKIIEFDGDYWHGEARGNQQRDKERDEKLISLGYKILRVRERDWKQDKESVIKECMEFLNA